MFPFMTWVNVIIPIDEVIFFRVAKNHQQKEGLECFGNLFWVLIRRGTQNRTLRKLVKLVADLPW